MSTRGGDHPYRERGDDVTRRIQRLWSEIDPLHARIAEPYWSHLGDELRQRIHELHEGKAEDIDHERSLEIYRDALRHAVDDAPRVERWLTALPNRIDESELGEPWRSRDVAVMLAREWTGSATLRQRSLAARIARWVGGHDIDSKILQHDSGAVRVGRFEAHGAPFALDARGVALDEDADITLITPTARAMAPLTLQEKHWSHIVGEWLLLQRDAETGDERFDERFFVEADTQVARRLLNTELRGALTHFARFTPPTLVLRGGFARLRWSYLPLAEMLDRAVSILSALRHMKIDISLLV